MHKLNLNNRIQNKQGAAGFIEILMVFSAIFALLIVFLFIVRVIVIKMNVTDIVRSELRVIEVLGRVSPSNYTAIKEKLEQIGIKIGSDSTTCQITVTQKPYVKENDDGGIIVSNPPIDLASLNGTRYFGYRDTVTLSLSVKKPMKIPVGIFELNAFNINYSAHYTGTVQRYYK